MRAYQFTHAWRCGRGVAGSRGRGVERVARSFPSFCLCFFCGDAERRMNSIERSRQHQQHGAISQFPRTLVATPVYKPRRRWETGAVQAVCTVCTVCIPTVCTNSLATVWPQFKVQSSKFKVQSSEYSEYSVVQKSEKVYKVLKLKLKLKYGSYPYIPYNPCTEYTNTII